MGTALPPQLNDASAERKWPAITTHNQGNHAIRTEEWRFIRYADGSKELYDLKHDPHEHENLAGKPRYRQVIEELSQWLPNKDVGPVPGSASRVLTLYDKTPVWEGKPIKADDPIPE